MRSAPGALRYPIQLARAAGMLGGTLLGSLQAAWILAAGRAHPRVDGRERVRGVHAPVEVVRDRHGVPHVFANGETDALFGQGYIHAQDRLFQMESMRRLAAGRLSEIAGAGQLASDRFMRRLGLAHLAARDAAGTGAGNRVLLDAYAAGVNAGIESLRTLPPEFAIARIRPEPWTAEHSMLVGRLMLFGFAGNWDSELLRERLLHELGPQRAALVDPAYPEGRVTHVGEPSPRVVERLLGAYEEAVEAGLPSGSASNAWAVTGEHSTGGAPLLASDPHLEGRLPPVFHVSHICGGEIDAAGADIAGVPGIAIGHNSQIAWGITAGMADVADCYVETVDPERPHRYLTAEGWVDGDLREERIAVRGGPSVVERVLVTRHGPVIGPAIDDERRAVALRCTALEGSDIVSPFLDVMRASDVESFEHALDRWPGATFNWVFAHVGGRIGHRLAGDVPRREPGEGLLPRDGVTSPGPPPPLPPNALPDRVDPPDGVVVSANHAPGGDLPLGEEWCEPWRAERIRELIDRRERHDVPSFELIQLDVYSAPMARLRDLLLRRGAVGDEDLRALLHAWDGHLTASSAGAGLIETIYQELAAELARRAAGACADIVLGTGLGGLAPHSSFHYRMQGWTVEHVEQPRPGPPLWVDAEDRDRVLAAAVERAVERLRAAVGPLPHEWRWGQLHPLVLEHPLHAVPVIGRLLSIGRRPFGGDVNTVAQGGYSVARGPATSGFTPAYRQVIDCADFDRSVFQLPAGNSGIPRHPRYGDCVEEYIAGRYRPLLFSRAAVDAATEHTLVLEPR